MKDQTRKCLHLLAWLAGALVVVAVGALVVWALWVAGVWLCGIVTFAGVKKVLGFVVFWWLLISLARLFWKLGSYYGRKL